MQGYRVRMGIFTFVLTYTDTVPLMPTTALKHPTNTTCAPQACIYSKFEKHVWEVY